MMQPDNIDPKGIFGARLKELRIARGISQEALAEKAGLDRTYISGCERGIRNVSLVNIYKISDALGVAPADFFPATGTQTSTSGKH